MTSDVARCLTASVLCLGMVSAGCSLAGPPSSVSEDWRPPDLYISQVPFFPQQTYYCGPSSLAAVLNYWGSQTSPEEIAQVIYSPRLKGTLGVDMWSYAQTLDYQAEMRSGTLKDLQNYVSEQTPVIAFLDLGYDWLPVPHFVVVVGLDMQRGTVITYNGKDQNDPIPFQTFMRAWQKTNHWTLVVRPKTEV
jgi:ABC-type bacteriocin/lantibiotic exporter with double-glycine peptidase domain